MNNKEWMRTLWSQQDEFKYKLDRVIKIAASAPLGTLWAKIRTPAFGLFWHYIKPKSIIIAIFLNFLKTFLEAGTLIVLILILGFIVGDTSGAKQEVSVFEVNLEIPFLSELIYGKNGLAIGLLILFFLALGSEAVAFSANNLIQRLQAVFSYEVRRDLFDKILNLELRFFTENKPGDLSYFENALVNRFSSLLPNLQLIFRTLLELFMTLTLLMLMSGKLTLILGISGFVLMILAGHMDRFAKRQSFDLEEAGQRTTSCFLDTLYGIRLVKEGKNQERIRDKYLKLAWERESKTISLQNYKTLNQAIVRLGTIVVLLVVAFGTYWFYGLNLLEKAGFGLAYLYIAMRALKNLTALQDLRFRVAIMIPQYMMVADFILDEKYLEDQIDNSLPSLQAIRKGIEVRSLRFSYNSHQTVLRDISVSFPVGKLTALVGLSGSGKTTLLELLSGIYKLQEGELLIDDADLRKYKISSYREKVGYVAQETIIMHDTLLENIRFLRYNASQQEIEEAVRLAMAQSIIEEAEFGYDTIAGERGLKISGGQRQRIALARVLVQNPSILFLDEATSALDLYTEAQIFQNLMRLKQDKIIVVAAHRLSAITNFDNIIVLHKGRIIEQGTHLELVESQGLYYHLFKLQEYAPTMDLASLAHAVGG